MIENAIEKYKAKARIQANKAPKPRIVLKIKNVFNILIIISHSKGIFHLQFPKPIENLLEIYGKTSLPPHD